MYAPKNKNKEINIENIFNLLNLENKNKEIKIDSIAALEEVKIVIEIKKINVMKFEYFIIMFLLFLRKNPKQMGKIIASQAPA